MRVEIVTDVVRLQLIEPEWEALFARLPGAVPFVSPAWLLPWWEVFHPGALHSVAVWDGERLVGLAPLYVEAGPMGRRLLPIGIGLSDLLDSLVDLENATTVGEAIASALADGDWHCWSAEDIPDGGASLALPDPAGWRSSMAPQSACPTLPLPVGGALRDAIPALKMRKYRMAQNRTARRSASLVCSTSDTIEADLGVLFRLHEARWRDRGEPGVLADPLVQQFHARAAPRLLARGLLRCSVLRIDGEAAGIFYGLHHGTTGYAYLGGFDPRFGFESPGTSLIGHAIEEAMREGATGFSFLRGEEPYKYEWGATDAWSFRRVFERVS